MTEGALSIWVMLIRDGSGVAASSLRASVRVRVRESDESFECDWPRKAAFS